MVWNYEHWSDTKRKSNCAVHLRWIGGALEKTAWTEARTVYYRTISSYICGRLGVSLLYDYHIKHNMFLCVYYTIRITNYKRSSEKNSRFLLCQNEKSKIIYHYSVHIFKRGIYDDWIISNGYPKTRKYILEKKRIWKIWHGPH